MTTEAVQYLPDVLVALDEDDGHFLVRSFAGRVITCVPAVPLETTESLGRVFVVGDVTSACVALGLAPTDVSAVGGYSFNVPETAVTVSAGQVPRLVPGIGVLYPKYFDDADEWYSRLTRSHALQSLTESTKPGESLRRGIYITRVTEASPGGDAHFNLLRCSTNLGGPTDNRRAVDDDIIAAVNELRQHHFPHSAELNHVLAQEYGNTLAESGKSKKAAISLHSDKTKDMPRNAVMAFVSFYDWKVPRPARMAPSEDGFDLLVGGSTSVYSRLVWHVKESAAAADPTLPETVSVTLGPGSVLLTSLTTNRLYRHETKPSVLCADSIPTRLSYVVRSSKTPAVFKDGATHVTAPDGALTPLRPASVEDVACLRELYLQENATCDEVEYGFLPFSMNSGDYLRPLV